MEKFKPILLSIMVSEEWTIRGFIAQEVLKSNMNIELFFRKLEKNGCASGLIESLTSYRDTYRFFNQHYREIVQLALDNNDDEEWFLFQWNDLPRSIVWLAVEQVARDMAREDLGLDI